MEAWERQNQAATGENHNNVPQLKEEDILRMNQGNADFLYNDEGYVTFLRGKFYEDKVTDTEKGVESLMGIAELLGLSWGSEFFAVYGEQDEYGYTYLTYKQRYGDLTLENAVLKIILDPQGYTAGLVSSFTQMWEWPRRKKALLQLKKQNRLYENGIREIKYSFIQNIPEKPL